MQLSHAVVLIALVLATVLITGYAHARDSGQERAMAREAQRRLAVAEHQRRVEDFARRCSKPYLSAAELEACRAAYRRL